MKALAVTISPTSVKVFFVIALGGTLLLFVTPSYAEYYISSTTPLESLECDSTVSHYKPQRVERHHKEKFYTFREYTHKGQKDYIGDTATADDDADRRPDMQIDDRYRY